VTTGIARTGVIGTLKNGTSRKSIGLRADMDALPIHETTNLPYASRTPGKMHACGHDGHTATLLAAARYLAETRNFDGTVHLIFQPAEENVSGARAMIDEGFIKRFPCDAIYAFHNIPGTEAGQVMVRPGAITAAVDIVDIKVKGTGGHGALPHTTVDSIVAASSIVMALQTIVSRNLDPLDLAVVTVGAFNAGMLATVIPSETHLKIGVRTCLPAVREQMERRIKDLATNQAKSFGCEAEIIYGEDYSYPAGFNAPEAAELVREVALEMGQDASRVDLRGPFMFSEDFAFFQEAAPACFFGLGNGDSRMLHDAGYDFNDSLLVKGAAVWVRLVERALAAN
jgi:hippurate hydrolase